MLRNLYFIIIFFLGALLMYIWQNFDEVVGPHAAKRSQTRFKFSIDYSDFISIMLTCVTIVLGAVAIGIGIVAFRTVKDIKNDAKNAVRNEVKKEMELFKTTMDATIANYKKDIYQGVGKSGGGELESDFDPSDSSER